MPTLTTTHRYAQRLANTAAGNTSDSITLAIIPCKLYTAGPTPTPDSKLGDFTEANFSGYAAVSAVPIGPNNAGDGSANLVFEAHFACDDDTTTPNTVLGAMFINPFSSPNELLGAAQFDAPIIITKKYDSIDLDMKLSFGVPSDDNTVEVD